MKCWCNCYLRWNEVNNLQQNRHGIDKSGNRLTPAASKKCIYASPRKQNGRKITNKMWLILKVKCRTLQFSKLWSSSKNAMAKNAMKRKRKKRFLRLSFFCVNMSWILQLHLIKGFAIRYSLCIVDVVDVMFRSSYSTTTRRMTAANKLQICVAFHRIALFDCVVYMFFFYKKKEWEISCEKSRHKLFLFFVNADLKVSTILSVHAI